MSRSALCSTSYFVTWNIKKMYTQGLDLMRLSFYCFAEQLGKIHFKKLFAFDNLYQKYSILRFLIFNIINYVLNCIKFAKDPTNSVSDTPVDQISNRISLRFCPHFLICHYIKLWTKSLDWNRKYWLFKNEQVNKYLFHLYIFA